MYIYDFCTNLLKIFYNIKKMFLFCVLAYGNHISNFLFGGQGTLDGLLGKVYKIFAKLALVTENF